MSRKAGRLLVFLLVLAFTVGIVAVLSAATQESPQIAADRYMEQVHSQGQPSAGLSAPAAAGSGISILASLGGFFTILLVPLAGFLIFAKSKRSAAKAGGRRQNVRRKVSDGKYRV